MINVAEIQAEASDALSIISRQRNQALHEAAMAETRAMKAERALAEAKKTIESLNKTIQEMTTNDKKLNGKAEESCPSPVN